MASRSENTSARHAQMHVRTHTRTDRRTGEKQCLQRPKGWAVGHKTTLLKSTLEKCNHGNQILVVVDPSAYW